jgi:NAD(P)-dependent dehydrogenase (short-subunit alcohol dehydrogenase family)
MEPVSVYASIHPRYAELAGKVAVVTGSSRNIGKGIATRLAREGMRVVVNGRTPETVEATTAELRDLELAEYGIRVNAVAPGATRTDRSPAPESERAGQIRQRVPLGRFGSTLEIGHAVAFLASEDAAYITGQVLYVDGGITAQLDPRTHPA